MERKKAYLQDQQSKMIRFKKRSEELLQQAKKNGNLHYYFDPKKCNKDEIIRLENGLETIIKKAPTLR